MGYVNAELMDLVKLYRHLTNRKVWVDAELRLDRKVSMVTEHDISQAEALSLIRNALRKDGVEIKEVGDSEAYVARAAP
jgi:hypothetical protein